MHRHFTLLLSILAAFSPPPTHAGEPLNPESKKGLQVQLIDDAIALGIHHAAINVNLLQLATVSDLPSADTLKFDGDTYAFNPTCVQALDKQIKPLMEHGVIVYIIILVYPYNQSEIDRAFVGPKYNPACPFHCASFKTDDAASAKRYKACLTYLARRYTRADGLGCCISSWATKSIPTGTGSTWATRRWRLSRMNTSAPSG